MWLLNSTKLACEKNALAAYGGCEGQIATTAGSLRLHLRLGQKALYAFGFSNPVSATDQMEIDASGTAASQEAGRCGRHGRLQEKLSFRSAT